MDERFYGNKRWIGLGALAIIFLCVMLCALGALGTMFMRSAPAYAPAPYVQPEVEEGAAPPATYYDGHGPLGMGTHGRTGFFGVIGAGIGMLFKLAFFGLLLLLLLGLVKRIFWGPRYWGHRHWGPPGGKPPTGKDWEEWKRKHRAWGPWAWHCHGAPPAAEAEAATTKDDPDVSESEYTGPQE
jgi:hypothetical protein